MTSSKRNGPGLIRFLLRHTLIGFGLAVALVAAMLTFDLGALATLAGQSDSGVLAVGLLTFFMGLSLASAQTGFALILASRQDSGDGGGSAVSVLAKPARGALQRNG